MSPMGDYPKMPGGNGLEGESLFVQKKITTVNEIFGTDIFSDTLDEYGLPNEGWSRPLVCQERNDSRKETVVTVGFFKVMFDPERQERIVVTAKGSGSMSDVIMHSTAFMSDPQIAIQNLILTVVSKMIKHIKEEQSDSQPDENGNKV
jgi:hypothetical protein